MGSHRNLGGVLVEYRPEVLTVRTEYMEVDTKKKTGKKKRKVNIVPVRSRVL